MFKLKSSDLRGDAKTSELQARPDSVGVPEIAVDPKYKTLGRRFLAGLLDSAIVLLVTIAVELLLLFVELPFRYPASQLILLPFLILYPVISTKVLGGTLGKLYFNVTVSQFRGSTEILRLSWSQSLLRESINIFSNAGNVLFIGLYYLTTNGATFTGLQDYGYSNLAYGVFSILVAFTLVIELATSAISKTRRSVHDYIGSSVVAIGAPYRPWSNLIAIAGFVFTLYVQTIVFQAIRT